MDYEHESSDSLQLTAWHMSAAKCFRFFHLYILPHLESLADLLICACSVIMVHSATSDLERRRHLFLCLWVLKEAHVKATGMGINAHPGLRGFTLGACSAHLAAQCRCHQACVVFLWRACRGLVCYCGLEQAVCRAVLIVPKTS